MKLPEQSNSISEPHAEHERTIGDQIMRFVMIPPENPEEIMIRDGVAPDVTGSRPMVETAPPITDLKSTHWLSRGRKSPKYIGER